MNNDQMIGKFIELSMNQVEALKSGSSAKANKYFKMLEKLLCQASEEGQLLIFEPLLMDENEIIRYKAAVSLIGIRTRQCIHVLEELARGHGLRKVDSYYFLEEWRKGRIKPLTNIPSGKNAEEADKDKLDERAEQWNNVIEIITKHDISELNPKMRKIALCFWYDSGMNNGGFLSFLDCKSNIDLNELEAALTEIGTGEIVSNFKRAKVEGKGDDWVKTDMEYYRIKPSLADCLWKYISDNISEIL